VKRSTKINLLLVLAVVLLAVLPVVFGMGDHKEEPFAGADTQAETAITENDPDYKPWFSPLYEPPSGEIESGLFALQAALGAGVVGYMFGVKRTRRRLAPEAADTPSEAETSASDRAGGSGPGRPGASVSVPGR
jgi:cobalt/nickel transport protein